MPDPSCGKFTNAIDVGSEDITHGVMGRQHLIQEALALYVFSKAIVPKFPVESALMCKGSYVCREDFIR